MKDLAPSIYRQRLVIEGIYSVQITPHLLEEYMHGLSSEMKMTIVYGPIVQNLAEKINPVHKGYEAIMIWAASGASVYTWDMGNFFTVDIYTCTRFDPLHAVKFTESFFHTKEIVFKEV